MRNLFGRRSRRLLIVAGSLFVLACGIAYATIPDADGVYTACVNTSTGAIRMIDPSADGTAGSCVGGENRVSWNKKGQDGAEGRPGRPG